PVWQQWLGIVLFLIATLYPRLATIEQYVTTDEVLWLYRSANFYYALGQREFEETYQKFHPGVMTMWAGMAGYLLEYPEYRGQASGYIKEPAQLAQFLARQDRAPLDLLVAGRVFIILQSTVLLLTALWLLSLLIPPKSAWWSMMLITLDPYYIGLSQILHVDALLGGWLFVSSLSMLVYLWRGKQKVFLWLSAVAAGAAILTKLTGLFILLFIGLVILIEWWQNRAGKTNNTKTNITTYFSWLLIAIATFIILWPAMWVNPIESLTRAFSTSFGFIDLGHAAPLFYGGAIIGSENLPPHYYLISYLWRSTIIGLAGLGLAIISVRFKWGVLNNKIAKKIIVRFALFAFFFGLALTLSAKKANRYLIPVFYGLMLISGLGWWSTIEKIGEKFSNKLYRTVSLGIGLILISLQTVNATPYYIGYFNPLLGGAEKATQNLTIGWGEGLDKAGRYLASKPNASELNVLAWYGEGPFSYYFPGKTNAIPAIPNFKDSTAKKLAQADYLAIYIHQWQRRIPADLLILLENIPAEHTVKINGLPYVNIYAVA
ncbi:MAG: phospholipid carrier-dependent glycosyltransferase, partial [Chloroflexota bacterium]